MRRAGRSPAFARAASRSFPRTRSAWPPCRSMTALENMALGDTRTLRARGRPRHGLGRARAATSTAALARLEVTLPSLDVPLGTLSGGNVQRMILARETGARARADRRVLSDARPRRAERDRGARAAHCARASGARRAADLGGPRRAVRAERPPRRALPRAHRRHGDAAGAERSKRSATSMTGSSPARRERESRASSVVAATARLAAAGALAALAALGLAIFAAAAAGLRQEPAAGVRRHLRRARSGAGTGSRRRWSR